MNTVLHIQQHRQALLICTQTLYGTIPKSFYSHDLDKEINPLLLIDYKKVKDEHRRTATHHLRVKPIELMTFEEKLETIMDWECAAFTKPDKPLNAYSTLYKLYNDEQTVKYLLPIIEKLGIAYETVPINFEVFKNGHQNELLHPIFYGKPEMEYPMHSLVAQVFNIKS